MFLTNAEAVHYTHLAMQPVALLSTKAPYLAAPVRNVKCHRLNGIKMRCRATVVGGQQRTRWHIWVEESVNSYVIWAKLLSIN